MSWEAGNEGKTGLGKVPTPGKGEAWEGCQEGKGEVNVSGKDGGVSEVYFREEKHSSDLGRACS